MKCLACKTLKLICLPATLLIVCIGCRNPINARNGAFYFDEGIRAEARGDYFLARKMFQSAGYNAEVGFWGSEAEARCFYEWARMSGYLHLYSDAESGYTNVLVLIDKSNGNASDLRAPTLCELARLYHDTGQYPKAAPIFEKAVLELEKREMPKNDPIGFAEFLDDYAESLPAAGQNEKAASVTEHSNAIRTENKGVLPKYKVRRYWD